MLIDIKGKINEKKLAYSNSLLPLFEAIVNSIQAIEEYSATEIGIIEIDIIRSEQKKLEFEENITYPDIIDFVIKDNGIGFTDENFNSFNYAHSTYKFEKGGKGIGRFTWLRAFEKAIIESRFKENDKWYLRKFKFEPTIKGIENHTLETVKSTEKRYTIIKLKGLKEEYRKWVNHKTEDIALKIIEHTFVYFLSDNCPRIIINDLGETIIVNDLFNLFTKGQVKTRKIKIRENNFKLSIVKLYSGKIDNKIHYCANTREVISDKIAIDIPEMDNFIYDKENNPFSIAVYVEGEFLDSKVNDERTAISFSKGEIKYPDEITQEELRKSITEIIKKEFKEQIEELSKKRYKKVKEFVAKHPRYRHLLKYRINEIKKVPSNLSEEKMEIELFKIQQTLELEVKKEAKQILKFIEDNEEREEFSKNHQELYSKIIEVGNSKLSEYVIHRKLVVNLFEKFLKTKAPERAVHSLIFPLQKLSDDIGFEDHNLWLIDDRLSYHKYLASDKKFKKMKLLNSNSNDRTDLIVFNKPFAFSNDEKPYNSIVLVEFKRPMRNDYTDRENPITQINRYAREIIEGIAKDKNDREFDIKKNTPIYAYIICDLTKNLKAFARDNGYRPLPNGDGFFNFNDNYNMYIEIMSFDKVLQNSKERNKVLFDKLNLT